ncbi:hypothetical protein Egran_06380 [Elaphomyces granulatus]|uniref:SigF-like NTF2-like domain-containing protein n=1 Tax=Elaphomyces granulatus TaxID=519963 RepID=A0A232LNW9_9EURO|nr:hypothetical protein Egran_06380 [Elaphomyces granulatus]
MEDPVREIPTVIGLLTRSPPSVQRATIEKFFVPSAAFSQPFCHVWSFDGSRWFIVMIYRFYKIMSPRVDMEIKSIAFDEQQLKLYVTMSQCFSIIVIPFYVAPVTLTTILTLTTNPFDDSGRHRDYQQLPSEAHTTSTSRSENEDGDRPQRYYIASQEDLYQTSEFVKFFLPYGIGVVLVMVWHAFSTAGCVLGAVFLWPVAWLEERMFGPLRGQLMTGVEAMPKRNGNSL